MPDTEQPHRHVLALDLQNVALNIAVGLRPGLNLEAHVPIRRVAVDAQFEDAAGTLLLGFESIHHRTETVSSLSDVSLWLRRSLPSVGPWTLDLRAGFTLPTGEVEPDPFELGEMGQEHQHIFFGTGTWDPQIGFGASRTLGNWGVGAWLRSRVPVDTSSEGYRAGSRGALGVSFAHPLPDARWSLLAQVEGYHEEPSLWKDQPARNSGRTDVVLGTGISYRPSGERWKLHGLLLIPENLSARGGQIDLGPMLSFGVSVSVGAG